MKAVETVRETLKKEKDESIPRMKLKSRDLEQKKKKEEKALKFLDNENQLDIESLKTCEVTLKNNKQANKPSKKLKGRDSEQRKQRQEERALKYLQNQHSDIKPSYKKGFNNVCGIPEGRKYTVSIAIPGSILDNIKSLENKCLVISQIARAASIFSVDEIVVYNEEGDLPEKTNSGGISEIDQGKCISELLDSDTEFNSSVLMAFVLKYLDTPEYLRMSLFPQCPCLSSVSVLPPLAIPSHLRSTHHFQYREGVVLENSENNNCSKSNLVDVGLPDLVTINVPQEVDSRITVKYGEPVCEVVNRDTPRMKLGAYWGFRVRLVNKLSGLQKQTCGFHDMCGETPSACKYDLVIGTSEKGTNVDFYEPPKFTHLLVVFGGKNGIEHAMELDTSYSKDSQPKKIFQAYLNTCPSQTSRTINTEESVFITLSALRPKICNKGRK